MGRAAAAANEDGDGAEVDVGAERLWSQVILASHIGIGEHGVVIGDRVGRDRIVGWATVLFVSR